MENNIIVYQTEDGALQIDVKLEDETVWLTQQQMAELYQTSRTNVVEHIKNIYADGELEENSTCRNFRQVRTEGNREVTRNIPYYNLDMIISLGYRVKSVTATRFRQWATKRLNEYIRKGFTMDDERLKNLGGGGYWKELLERIRDIRASEKVFYRQVLDIYATSIDYDPKADISIEFFKKVQNKIHYAVHGQTAAEVIYTRADSEKEFMGLMSFKGSRPHLSDAVVAKNYLNEKELRSLGQLVSGYLDFAERQAEREQPMTMKDWAEHLDRILTMSGEKLLEGNGKVSHKQAVDKATEEYKKYQSKTLSEVEKDYLDAIVSIEKKAGTHQYTTTDTTTDTHQDTHQYEYKNGKWAEKIISLQNSDGTWGNMFHSLCPPNKRYPLTTEQALRRLKILGFTIKDVPVRKSTDCMIACLRGERKIDDCSEKSHDWKLFTKLMLSAWVRIFEPDNETALSFAKQWANVISKAFESGTYNDTAYTEAYISEFHLKPNGSRERDFVDFYHLNLLKDTLPYDIESSMLDYVFSKSDGIYYIYDKPIMEVPKAFKSKEASRYLEAIEILSEYKSSKDKLGFVIDWLNDNKDENGQWDLGVQSKDNLHFPLSDSWKKSSDRIKDCTYRIEKIISNIS